MQIKKANREYFIFAIKDSAGALITNLSTATAVKFMIKENKADLDSDAIVSKAIGTGVAIDTPVTGYVTVTVDATDIPDTIEAGGKYAALQIEWSATNKVEVYLKEKGKDVETIEVLQDVIR